MPRLSPGRLARHAAVFLFAAGVAASGSAVVAQQASPPNPHGPLPAGMDCGACHSAQGWRPAKRPMDFDHSRRTAFPLTGKHQSVSCTGCHLDLRFDEPGPGDADCADCHLDVHRSSLGAVCTTCHNTRAFGDLNGVALHTRTRFPLTGAHLEVTCESCHRDDRFGAYAPLDPDCIACHRADYAAAQSVNHQANGFPTDCVHCHSTLAWGSGVGFDHAAASGRFALAGAHVTIRCESCHVMPSLAPKYPVNSDQDCIACHQDDYDQVHAGDVFPTTCTTCHTVTSWKGGLFVNHDQQFFPIYSGPHRGKWGACQTCHTVPNDFRSFTCLVCHEHEQTRMDEKHRGRQDYAYDSNRCYACHPDGRKEGR